MKHHLFLRSAALATAIALIPALAVAATIRGGFDTNSLAANDDGSTGLVAIGFSANFFGVTNNQLYVNNNGNVTFDVSLMAYTPFDLNSTSRQIIAPFFADIDTRGSGSSLTTYGTGTVDGRAAFGVNWVDVGYYDSNSDLLNDIQLILVDRSDLGAGNFDIEFNYGDIEWETGGASDGVNGFGGDSARAGFSNGTGDPGSFFEIAGSAINGAFINDGPNELRSSSNIGVDGRFLFTAREGTVVNPPVDPDPNVVPLPATGLLLMGGVALLGAVRRRRT